MGGDRPAAERPHTWARGAPSLTERARPLRNPGSANRCRSGRGEARRPAWLNLLDRSCDVPYGPQPAIAPFWRIGSRGRRRLLGLRLAFYSAVEPLLAELSSEL